MSASRGLELYSPQNTDQTAPPGALRQRAASVNDNAAGLNAATVSRYAGKGLAAQAEQIQAIRVQGETLTKMQEQGALSRFMEDAVGQKRDIAPATPEQSFNAMKQAGQIGAGEDYETYLHGMDEVIGSMEAGKSADETALKDCVRGAA